MLPRRLRRGGATRPRTRMALGALVLTGVAVADIISRPSLILLTALLVGPLIAAAGATAWQTAGVAAYSMLLTLPCAAADEIWGTEGQLTRTAIVVVSSAAAVGFALLRQVRDDELART